MLPKMQLEPLIVGYEIGERGDVLTMFGWIDIAVTGSIDGLLVTVKPATMFFTISSN
jgi:hypothetical protein